MRRALACAACALAGASLAACESTQDKNAKLAKGGAAPFKAKGLTVTRRSSDVTVSTTAVLSDANGTAAVVGLRNRSKKALAQVPVAIDVTSANGKSVFKNDAPGLEPSLTSAALLRPGEELMWVDDQVQPTGSAKKVKASIGIQKGRAPASVPQITVSSPKLQNDPTSGVNASGTVTNGSKLEQLKLTLFAVARKGNKIVAAGRGAVPRLKPGKHVTYHIFFIGDPRGARITVAAPPTVLG